MTVQNNNTKRKRKATSNNKNKARIKKKKKGYKDEEKKISKKVLVIITFLTGVLLIVASYAWLSQSLNVKVKFFDMSVSTDNGLFISLDGVDFSDSVEISMNSVIADLKPTYPNHTNQWATAGLTPVSTIGIRNSSSDRFDVYSGEVSHFKDKKTNRRFLNTTLITEERPDALNAYIAFDLFFKNVSGSPKSDNLYLDDGTAADFNEGTSDDVKSAMANIMNSMRFGFVKIGTVPTKSDVKTIQNQKCNNNCQVIIYEPNSIVHTTASIDAAKENNIDLVDGAYSPTYAVINAGDYLEHINGQEGSGVALDTDHFALQRTITSFAKPIYQVPDGITKVRVYVWIEGQDMDSIETYSKGAAIAISINFVKDLAGYN